MNLNRRTGFTLVELLVVISIIAMLAGLLLPAINAARENGRRIQCVSNQKQVAFALLNFEGTKGAFPPLRGPLKPSVYWRETTDLDPRFWDYHATDAEVQLNGTELTWVSFILPFIEQNTAWAKVTVGIDVGPGNLYYDHYDFTDREIYELVIPVMQCKSAGISPGENRISYVANAGPLNPHPLIEYSRHETINNRRLRNEKMYTIFFDHFAIHGLWTDHPIGLLALRNNPRCETKISVENISSMDGTSTTILLSENEDAGHWIWCSNLIPGRPIASGLGGPSSSLRPREAHPDISLSEVESRVGFCYPGHHGTSYANWSYDAATSSLSSVATGEIPTYEPSNTVDAFSPMFINEGRRNFGVASNERTRKARPSSAHPGGVVTAFCDNGVRFLRDDIDKTLFVRLCRPGSGVILNPKDLGW